MSEPYTYEEAMAVAQVAARLDRCDVPCPGGAVKVLLARIAELEATPPPVDPSAELFVEGWMRAREQYGAVDEDDDGGATHGGECSRVQGPYVCTCDEAGERTSALDAYRWFHNQS